MTLQITYKQIFWVKYQSIVETQLIMYLSSLIIPALLGQHHTSVAFKSAMILSSPDVLEHSLK